MDIYLKGKRIRIDPQKSIGKGGEADVFDIGGGRALKIFKPPNHPDLDKPEEKIKAERKLAEHQKKLPAFPHNLPPAVIAPEELALDQAGKIAGYAMRYVTGAEVLLRYAEKKFRQMGVSQEKVVTIFKSIHATVRGIHEAKVVIGDFNDLNVLVKGREAIFIDSDSFQFGNFLSITFTERFLDPLLSDPKEKRLLLARPQSTNSDWYAFAVMLMQCLLFVGPYGGIYRPKNPKDRLPQEARPLRRITVFDPDVGYPKPAIPYKVLPDALLDYFYKTFKQDQRGEFPFPLLEDMHWTRCPVCSTEHARTTCPNCLQVAPAAIKEAVTIRGQVKATRVFRTSGIILYAALQENKLLWLYHENDKFKREDGQTIISGELDPQMRFRLSGTRTLLGKDNNVVTLSPGKEAEKLAVDAYGNLPIFDANEKFRYWTENGQLFRDGDLGPKIIGNVLAGQTLFWVGSKLGFGFYWAGNLKVAFLFDALYTGINDNIALPALKGQLVDSTAVFASDAVWFLLALKEGSKIVNRCFLIEKSGKILAEAEADAQNGDWLGTLRGKCAAGKFLFAPTDDGIVRLEAETGKIVKTREFPDTEPFVDTNSHLFASSQGIYTVQDREIILLKIG